MVYQNKDGKLTHKNVIGEAVWKIHPGVEKCWIEIGMKMPHLIPSIPYQYTIHS